MKKGAFFQWSEKYLIGHNRIDQDHQYLFELLQQAISTEPDDNYLYAEHQLLNNLMDFSHIHFMDEEALMQSIHFSAVKEHIACHHFLLQRTEDLLDKVKLGYTSTLPDIIAHLKEWIGIDILGEDVQLGLAIAGH